MSNPSIRFRPALPLCAALLSGLSPAVFAAYSYGDPSVAEQIQLEAINRARANPIAEAARLGLSSLTEGTRSGAISSNPVPPVTLSPLLTAAARKHSANMAAQNFFAHVDPSGGDPATRATAEGYDWQFIGENIAFVSSTAPLDENTSSQRMHDLLFEDKDYPERGHRVAILTSRFKEIGAGLQFANTQSQGFTFNAYYLSVEFGQHRTDTRSFILGVAYKDSNNDQFYSAGEGIGGIQIKVKETGDSGATATAGGYAFQLSDGNYTLEFTNAAGATISRQVSLSGQNVKLDILDADFSAAPVNGGNGGTGGDNTGSAQTAAYNLASQTLSVPVIQVGNGFFTATLHLDMQQNGFVFTLQGSDLSAISTPSNPVDTDFFEAATGLVHLNNVDINGASYTIKLKLLNGAPPYRLEVNSVQKR